MRFKEVLHIYKLFHFHGLLFNFSTLHICKLDSVSMVIKDYNVDEVMKVLKVLLWL
jgi:hypothetical protein